MDFLVERSSTGFRDNTKSNVGILIDVDIDNDEDILFDTLKETEEKYLSPKTTIKFVGLEPIFHKNREMRKDGPIAYEVICIINQNDDLIKFKNTVNLYRLTKIKRL